MDQVERIKAVKRIADTKGVTDSEYKEPADLGVERISIGPALLFEGPSAATAKFGGDHGVCSVISVHLHRMPYVFPNRSERSGFGV